MWAFRGYRRVFFALSALLLGWAAPLPAAQAQEWPNRPIRILVGFPPGQATDVIARLLAERFTENPGWSMLIDNRPGQGGSLAAAQAAQSAPDGQTLLLSATAPLATNPNLYANVGYDPRRDFAPISLVANLPFVLFVNTNVAARNVAELIALAKARPGQLTYATSGNGTTSHLITMMFARAAGRLELTHVPYRGGAPALTDLLAGRIDIMIDTELFALPHIREGRVRALAVTTAQRTALQPDLPSLTETGLEGFDAAAWLGLVAPAGTPRPIVERFNRELHRILAEPATRERLSSLGAQVMTSTPDDFLAFMRSEYVKWGNAVRENNVKLD
ncbi:MAG: tripartite tricarboxylate transporter substrate binding protein [Alphaproteobacteria bacterium]|nr:tripartite tricarboxylate transporter substrate binding protein [Alphaproteobacteria bacterium]